MFTLQIPRFFRAPRDTIWICGEPRLTYPEFSPKQLFRPGFLCPIATKRAFTSFLPSNTFHVSARHVSAVASDGGSHTYRIKNNAFLLRAAFASLGTFARRPEKLSHHPPKVPDTALRYADLPPT